MSRNSIRNGAVAAALAALAACSDEPTAPNGFALRTCGGMPITLEVGQSARSLNAETSCRLLPTPGARYALAFLDASSIHAAETSWEPAFTHEYTLHVTLGAPPAPGATPQPVAPRPESQQASDVIGVAPIDTPAERATPWTGGERFEIRNHFSGAIEMARVVRIYDNHYVVAWLEQGDSTRLAGFLPRLDSAYAVIRSITVPLLRRTFVDTVPRSSTGSGQYLILLADSLGPNGGFVFQSGGSDDPLTWMYLKSTANNSQAGTITLLAHELTHSYQFLYMHATRAPGGPAYFAASFWGVEGGANTISYFTLGRHVGIAPDANRDWRAAQPDEASALHARRAQPVTGEFTRGYDNAMGFLRDLVLRRMATGEPVDDALREVSRGAIEGWFGRDGFTTRTGLTARMRSRLGSYWEPAQALLDWTLSHAADDRTPNPYFQDRASLRVWDIPTNVPGWREAGSLRSSTGGEALINRYYGSPLFLYLQDDGQGIDVQVEGLGYGMGGAYRLEYSQFAVLRIE